MMLVQLVLFAVVHQALCLRMGQQRLSKKSCYMCHNPILSPKFSQRLERIESKIVVDAIPDENEMAALRMIDLSKADNYFESTKSIRDRRRSKALKQNDMQFVADTEDAFTALQDAGFSRRFKAEHINSEGLSPFSSNQKKASTITSELFELRKSKEQQLADLKSQKVRARLGIEKLLPKQMVKYLDYFRSLRIEPNRGDQQRCLMIAAFFSAITIINLNLRSTYMYVVVGVMMSASQLLSRNQPVVEYVPGQPRRQLGDWSKNSFLSAIAVTLFYAMSSFLGTLGLLTLTGMDFVIRMKLSLVASLMSAAYFTTFYEVFEAKGKNGWRWKKAMQGGSLSAEEEAKLAKAVYGKQVTQGSYTYEYDPQVDDYPRQPKYLDELEGAAPICNPAGGDLDEGESKQHFDKWYTIRKDARKAPITEASSEEPWVGGKAGLFMNNFPSWLEKAYMRNVLKANKWRNKPTKDVKDYSEFEPIAGPWTFRDKRSDWLDIFGSSIFEEKLQVSRKAARAFGTYRKSMWKIDKEVTLLPCDGGDKKPPGAEKKPEDDTKKPTK